MTEKMKKSPLRSMIFLMIFLLFAYPSTIQADEPVPGLDIEQIKSIIDAASGERALNHIRHLSLFHRWFVSDGYKKAARYVLEEAKEMGLDEAAIETFPSDGKIHYSTNRTLPQWRVRSAELGLISPVKKHLVSWEENPIVLASNSRSADITTELVDVGEGTAPSDYEGKDVRGKLVLASSPQSGGRIELVHRMAVLDRGAAGVISYRSYYLDDFPDLVTWDHIWTLEKDGRPSTFGFCLSKRMGWELQRLLKSGEKVILRARVDADLSAGEYEVVKACIPGTDLADQEIWFIAHLDHCLPSANDNASGSGAVLESARALLDTIKRKELPHPRRTIRFFWVPEIFGTYAYISKHPEETEQVLAVINMDMVGENQDTCGSVFRVTQTPDSCPSVLNDILRFDLDFLLSQAGSSVGDLTDPLTVISPFGSREDWKAQLIPYSGGSDHYVFMGGVLNVPATMFGSWPDYFYHSSGDTPDKSDPTQLKRAVVLGMMAAASMANLDGGSGLDLLDRVGGQSLLRMDLALERALRVIRQGGTETVGLKEALNIVRCASIKEKRTLRSVEKYLPGDRNILTRIARSEKKIDSRTNIFEEMLREEYRSIGKIDPKKPVSVTLSDAEKKASLVIPVRNPEFPGPIDSAYLSESLSKQDLELFSVLSGLQLYEIGAFIDGKRSSLEIRNAVSAECGPVLLEDVLAYLGLLEKTGLVTFR
jgi:aminopeptidase YwaD